MDIQGVDAYSASIERVCKLCELKYSINQFADQPHYFEHPWDYISGCETYCLNCWLVGETPSSDHSDLATEDYDAAFALTADTTHQFKDWNYEACYTNIMNGILPQAFQGLLFGDTHLVIMPIARVHLSKPIVFPHPAIFYPPGSVPLEILNIIPNSEESTSLAEVQSAASGVDIDVFSSHTLIAFPHHFKWGAFCQSSHDHHMEFIRELSGTINNKLLNFIRYQECRIHPIDNLPAQAGQLWNNHMMAGALLYNHTLGEGRIIGGAAFTHIVTRGLGLSLDQPEWDRLPKDGEVGKITSNALALYAALLEANDPTAKFMQALALLEFVADPNDFVKWEKIKKIIARYVTQEPNEYKKLLDRFIELTSKKDPSTNKVIGYRTRVVHMGERIDCVVPDRFKRQSLFLELDHYIRCVIDHLLKHSESDFEHYAKTLRPKAPGRDHED